MSATKDARIKELEAELIKAIEERDEARTQAQQAISELAHRDEQYAALQSQHEQTSADFVRQNTELVAATANLHYVTAERDQYRADYEAAREAHNKALEQRDDARDLVNELATPATEGDADPYAEHKDAMRRNGLSKAWVTPDGQVFYAERHAQEWAGSPEVFATLDVLTVE